MWLTGPVTQKRLTQNLFQSDKQTLNASVSDQNIEETILFWASQKKTKRSRIFLLWISASGETATEMNRKLIKDMSKQNSIYILI